MLAKIFATSFLAVELRFVNRDNRFCTRNRMFRGLIGNTRKPESLVRI